MDLNVMKLLFFAYKNKSLSVYDKIILASHWVLINNGFRVQDMDETVINYILFY